MDDTPTRAEMSDDLDAFRWPPLPTGLHPDTLPACDDLHADQDQAAADSRWLAKHRHSRQKNLNMPPVLRPSHRSACYSDGQLDCVGPPCPADRDTH